jgi:hypothetical protein
MKEIQQTPADDNDSNPFITLGQLIRKGVAIQDLATAIDDNGIYAWNGYICTRERDDMDTRFVLGLLKGQGKWLKDFGKYVDDNRTPLSPLERCGEAPKNAEEAEDWDNPFEQLGWPKNSLPKCVKDHLALKDSMHKPKGHLNHDLDMQMRANEIAAEIMKAKNRRVTRNEVAKLLAQELGMDPETVIRRIRKKW